MLPILTSISSGSVRKLSSAFYMSEAAWYSGKNTGLVVKDMSYSLALLVTNFYNLNIFEP